MIDSVIFDMDGLMFDTERVWATLWEPALATLGLSYKEGLDVAARGTAGGHHAGGAAPLLRGKLRHGRHHRGAARTGGKRRFRHRRPKSPDWTKF